MKILVIGGMHGNEPLGLNVVKSLQNKPIENVDAIVANEKAVRANTRFTEQDLNRSFPGVAEGMYEERRAAELVELCKQYDVVLDFHNTYCPDNDCGFIGKEASKNLLSVASYLGLDKIIVADYDCINKYASNCLSVEVSMPSEKNNAKEWVRKIETLGDLSEVKISKQIKMYKFAYRMTLEDKERLNLENKNLQVFKPISKELALALGVDIPAYPIFIGDGFTPYNYGGILNDL